MNCANKFCIVSTTITTIEEARELANKILNQKLASCIQFTNIESLYWWNDEISNDNEIRIIIKTKDSLFEELKNFIVHNHKYQIPEIIKIPILDGYFQYLEWIEECTK
ncbi:MAG: divalent-cation tolerance protein CutA [Campylobacterales bacterium]|nr:divalent-cation tolerance protein CutA [Campylobacterales bacterium]